MSLPYPVLQVRPERTKNLRAGHPWLFSGALAGKPKVEDGSLVRVCCGTEFLGVGTYNGRTDIAVRMLTRVEEVVDADFFARRFAELRDGRLEFVPAETTAWREVFAEADGLPGLVVDRYGDTLVMQLHTLGMDRLRGEILQGLLTAYRPAAVIERSDVAVRRLEGLNTLPVSVLHGTHTGETRFTEYGHVFFADLLKGQKTGFFLDQRENRHALTRWCRGRAVLNVFSYSGGFSVYAAAAGARRVASLDASAPAMALCVRNLAANGHALPENDFITADAFEYLGTLTPGTFDCIIVDPPSMAKSSRQLPNAIRAYTTLNRLALQALPDHGILVSASCTTHVDRDTFGKVLHHAAAQAGCTLQVLDSRDQPFDHPYRTAFPEGRYLKFVVARKLHP